MNAEEPLQAPLQNLQIGAPSGSLPETHELRVVHSIPRPISFFSLIHQWQPMGIRIIINTPFVGDDANFLFFIRNGPYIPRWDKDIFRESGTFRQNVGIFHFNNTRPVFLGVDNLVGRKSGSPPEYPKDYRISLTHYDYPPIFSTLAQCFRKWRGDISYRLRMTASFATQGYILGTILKNTTVPIGIYDEYKYSPTPLTMDSSYREAMANAYTMSDVSMFRHLELTVPFDYPVKYYDQYHWFSQRLDPLVTRLTSNPNFKVARVVTEPHGDNFVAIGLRGELSSTQPSGRIIFDLEYRAVEGFQFASPGIPPGEFMRPYYHGVNNDEQKKKWATVKIIPNPADAKVKWRSDGIGSVSSSTLSESEPVPSILDRIERVVPPTTTTTLEPPTLPPNKDFVTPEVYESPSTTEKPYQYKRCTVDTRTGQLMTYCLDQNDKWKMFKGDHRESLVANGKIRHKRDTEGPPPDDNIVRSLLSQARREREFLY